DSYGPAAADRNDGCGESDVGRATHCRGTPREARDSSLAADSQAIYAVAPTPPEAEHTGVDYVHAQPRCSRASRGPAPSRYTDSLAISKVECHWHEQRPESANQLHLAAALTQLHG